MLSDSLPNIGSNNGKSLGDCYNKSADFDKNYILHWSPQEDCKLLYKNKYVASSKSVPHRNRRLARYRISRSLNFDTTMHSTSSDNSSLESDKHLSRSAKIMRALNLNNSPTYYGKTKIKKALNFNSTPSPKSFTRTRKSVRKAVSLSFNSSMTGLNKVLNYDESPIHSPNSSIVFTSPESMDENQNETPSQRRFKAHTSLTYSTPNPKYNLDSPVSTSFSPLLRSGLKKKIDNIIYVGTPNLQSVKSSKTRVKHSNEVSMSTPRNLFNDFHDEDNDRPCTPENIIAIVPESMSAIKRSHKKERLRLVEKRSGSSKSSKQQLKSLSIGGILSPDVGSDDSITQLNLNNTDPIINNSGIQYSNKKNTSRKRVSDGNISDTGSIFDYTEDCNNISKESEQMEHDSFNESQEIPLLREEDFRDNDSRDKVNITAPTGNNDSFTGEIEQLDLSVQDVSMNKNDVEINDRPITPNIVESVPTSPQTAVTPENRLNYLHRVMQDSIKKSHRKLKDENRKRLFSPQVLHRRLDVATPAKTLYPSSNQHEDITENKPLIENHDAETAMEDRAVTPEKINSSRLLLSQYSSVKKSHRKDKHNKMVSSFKRRQEYFNNDMDGASNKSKISSFEALSEKSTTPDSSAKEFSGESSSSDVHPRESTSSDNLSPSKRKSPYISSDSEIFTPKCDAELEECNSPKDEFRIFTPLKRRKSLTSPAAKGYLCVYQLPSGKDEISEEADAQLLRCITPVSRYPREYTESPTNIPCNTSDANIEHQEEPSSNLSVQEASSPQEVSGRSTPLNMSTTELYTNLDSIKKSHKKNKRRPRLQRELAFPTLNSSGENEEQDVSKILSTSDSISDTSSGNNLEEGRNGDKSISSISSDDIRTIAVTNDTQETSNTNTIKTPPACLRTLNYIKLLHSTSIKRSHKKERDRKKVALDKHDLSNDGSIFGDDEKQTSSESTGNSCSNN